MNLSPEPFPETPQSSFGRVGKKRKVISPITPPKTAQQNELELLDHLDDTEIGFDFEAIDDIFNAIDYDENNPYDNYFEKSLLNFHIIFCRGL